VSTAGSTSDQELFPTERMPIGLPHSRELDVGRQVGPFCRAPIGTSVNPPERPRDARRPGGLRWALRCTRRLEHTPCWVAGTGMGWAQVWNWLTRPLAATIDVGIDLVAMCCGTTCVNHQQHGARASLLFRCTSPRSSQPRRPWPHSGEGLPTAAGKAGLRALLGGEHGPRCRGFMPLAAATILAASVWQWVGKPAP